MPVLSVVRDELAVYIQIAICLFVFLFSRSGLKVMLAVVAVVYGSYIAPMDNESRYGGLFPSIHTLSIFGALKGIDLILLFLCVYSLRLLRFDRHSVNRDRIFGVLAVCVLSVLASTVYLVDYADAFDFSVFLFVLRGCILWSCLFLNLSRLSRSEISRIAYMAICTCVILMILSILFPTKSPLTRDLFGYTTVVAFAGDEYNTIGLLSAAVLIIGLIPHSKLFLINAICLILSLLAGRKASVSYFIYVFLLILSSRYDGFRVWKWMLSSEHFSTFFGLFWLSSFGGSGLTEMFIEPLGIFQSTIQAVGFLWDSTPVSAIIGIGPFSKYKMLEIDTAFDHQFSFGKDAGEVFRFKLWFLPFDRAFINFGVLSVVYILSVFWNSIRRSPAEFYMALWTTYFVLLVPCSTNMILSLAIAWSAASIKNRNQNLMPETPTARPQAKGHMDRTAYPT